MIVESIYIISAALLAYGIQLMGKPSSARKGNCASAFGMLLAILATLKAYPLPNILLTSSIVLVGSGIGILMAKMIKMTAIPEMVALLNGFGGLASFAVGIAEEIKLIEISIKAFDKANYFAQAATCLTIIIGGITFTGSIIAYGKLSRLLPSKPIIFMGQNWLCIILIFILIGIFLRVIEPYFSVYEKSNIIIGILIGTSLLAGVFFMLHIGGGDMPVMIALLNSLSGLAACTAGLIILNKVLIVAGCLVGTSGFFLTLIMCKAMNRSIHSILLNGFKLKNDKGQSQAIGEMKPISIEDAYYILEAAQTVAIIPGYGMAVAQAQHAVKEVVQKLMTNGTDVFFAIHPVAGRMPGHMNVLLAEADIDYRQLTELKLANARLANVDVALVIGANDVVNPAAIENPNSPLYGMPVLEVFRAKTVFVLKRGKGKGFSGLENDLFFKANTRMLYGDAKKTLMQLVAEFKE